MLLNNRILASVSQVDDDQNCRSREERVNTGFLNKQIKNDKEFENHRRNKDNFDQNGNILNQKHEEKEEEYKLEVVWLNVIIFSILHVVYVVGVLTYWRLNLITLYYYIFGVFAGISITAGAHRLWAHGAYKAKLPLRLFLAFFQTAAFQNTIYEWVRDHRTHHKFTDTNADPHNATRGFFFCHMGWLMCKKHPDVKKYGVKVDMSDLLSDPVVAFQKKYYYVLLPLCHTIIPIALPMMFFSNVTFIQCFCLNIYRFVTVLHITWLVNSWAHFFGTKPFDKNIKPTETYLVSFLSFGEGWHNYHHVFPYDYKTSEHSTYWFNFTTAYIDLMAWLGLATDLKFVEKRIIYKRAIRTGDGSLNMDDNPWGWNDEVVRDEDKEIVTILNKTDTGLR